LHLLVVQIVVEQQIVVHLVVEELQEEQQRQELAIHTSRTPTPLAIDREPFQLRNDAASFQLAGCTCYSWTNAYSYLIINSIDVYLAFCRRELASEVRSVTLTCSTLAGKQTTVTVPFGRDAADRLESVDNLFVMQLKDCFGPDDYHTRLPNVGKHVITVNVSTTGARTIATSLAPIEVVRTHRK